MAQSQGGNFRHRWDGLSVRLADDLRQGKAVPRKRIAPGSRRTLWIRRQLIRLRRKMSRQSHATFTAHNRKSNLGLIHANMEPFVYRKHSISRIDKDINKSHITQAFYLRIVHNRVIWTLRLSNRLTI